MQPVILASSSPRRQELLRQIGMSFVVDPADIDERLLPGEQPEVYALRLARGKARTASRKNKEGIVVAADTIVILDAELMGKPVDARDAEGMLERLSGREHRVITGLAIMDAASGKLLAKTAETKVWFRTLEPEEIRSYVATGEPLDKAGAYGIQGKGALLIERIEGCYYNVVGLPLSLLSVMLGEFGVHFMK